MSYNNLGKVWTPDTLGEELATIKRPTWIKGITLHHCAEPSLAQRPRGLTLEHIRNIRDFYRDQRGWDRGPHLFTDEDQVFGLTPLTEPGIHAVSFNKTHLGIEVLGNYDVERPHSERGLACWQTTARTVRVLLDWLKLPMTAYNFHRDDPKTTKTCPGRLVTRMFMDELVSPASARQARVPQPPVAMVPVLEELTKRGVRYEAARTGLTKRDGEYWLFGCLLEGARYDSAKETTVAPMSEIMDVKVPLAAMEVRK